MPAAASAPRASATVASALSVNVAVVIPVFLFGGLAVQMSGDLGITVGTIGLVTGLYFAGCGLTSIPAGRLVERFGAPKIAAWGILLSAAAMLAIAAFAQGPVSLTVLILLSSPANALGQLASNAVLSHWAPAGHKGLFFGVKQSSIPLCTMLGGLSVPLIALTLGWRWAWVAGAALALLALVPLAGLRRVEARTNGGGGVRVFDWHLIVFAVATCLGAAAGNPIGSFLTTYAVDIGASETLAGLTLTFGGLVGIAARTGFGALADRLNGREFGLIALTLLGGAAGVSLFLFGQVWLLPVGTAAGFALGWVWPGLVTFGIAGRYPHAPAAATSITQTGVYAGGAIGPIAFGIIAEHAGWNPAWAGVAAAMAAAAVLIWVGARMTERAAAA